MKVEIIDNGFGLALRVDKNTQSYNIPVDNDLLELILDVIKDYQMVQEYKQVEYPDMGDNDWRDGHPMDFG